MQPKYYVITKRSMGNGVLGGKDATAVFREARDCQSFQKENGGEIEPRVVIGEITDADHVFVADEYHSGEDLHWFVGLYGNFELAKQAAGERSAVRQVKLQ